MSHKKKYAFLFPGQGAQYPGMGKDFFDHFPVAKQTFEEADDILGRHLSRVILEGPEADLTTTKNSQPAIYVTSIAILRTLQSLFPDCKPFFTAGLSLGEYTALIAAQILGFHDGLRLVQTRANLMNQACEAQRGSMAVVLGLSAEQVETLVKSANLPKDLWVANYNCPGQVVVSGTLKGLELFAPIAKAGGAKRVLPLSVHGAFHSGLMQEAEHGLAHAVDQAKFVESSIQIVMNVTGQITPSLQQIKENLIRQVTGSVCWEQGVRQLEKQQVDAYIEIGCGKTLSGFNKRIEVSAPTISIEKIEDVKFIETLLTST